MPGAGSLAALSAAALFGGALFGGAWGVVAVRMINGRAGRKTLVPYGPAMLAGALVAIVVSALRASGTG